MIDKDKLFNTKIFSGGSGMLVQYHDVIKPVYFFTVLKMILTGTSFGLPLDMISHMPTWSLVEWYTNRKYVNPLRCLDPGNILDKDDLDDLLKKILGSDKTIYKLTPALNIRLMIDVYKQQQLSFPIFVYSEDEDPMILSDCRNTFPGVKFQYLFGDIKEAIKKCDQNFTYILSDIELMKSAIEALHGTCSNVILSEEYRYNYKDYKKSFKYNLSDLQEKHPFVRTSITTSMDVVYMLQYIRNILSPSGGNA